MSHHPRVLFGPYGTLLEDRERETGTPGLADPLQILNGPVYREAIGHVARAYRGAGANVATTNTFRVRNVLGEREPEAVQKYGDIVGGHVLALREALHGIEGVESVISLGPAADCYEPELAPDALESEEFHGYQIAEVAEHESSAWFETVNTIREGLGIARAAKKRGVRCIISFVIDIHGNLLSGESLADAMKEIDGQTGAFPAGYSLNCCPIEGIQRALESCGTLRSRVIAVYPNASSRPHSELSGRGTNGHVLGVIDPNGVAGFLNHLAQQTGLHIIGGCCGFTPKDIASIALAVQHGLTQTHLPRTDAHPDRVS